MVDSINFESIKVSLRQDKNGFLLTLSIHPDEIPELLVRDFVGARYVVAMARIGDDEQPFVRPKVSSFVQTAGILARDPEFQAWCVEMGHTFSASEDDAADAIHSLCEIDTRAELSTDTNAQSILMDLRKEFETWKSRKTS